MTASPSISATGLEGRVALVTGASRGIGRAVALALASAGADVALAARGADQLEAVAQEVTALGGRALALTCDVTDADQVERLLGSVEREFGRLDVLVNNAGGAHTVRPLEDVDGRAFERGIALNLTAVQNTMRAAARLLRLRSDGAAVVNIVSIAAARGIEGMSYYSAAKAAVVGLTRAAAREWGPHGIRVNCLGPGWIETELSRPLREDEDFFARSIDAIPLRRWGRPEEVASAALFLASDASRYVNGTTLYVDGGLLA
jgi:NAD(P)-dependent dehydrogenase (short-subunit alcohol dehydrogenase family)